MNAIRSILAVSILVTAGLSNAAIAETSDIPQISASINIPGFGELVTASSGTGTASLDNTGILTIEANVSFKTLVGDDATVSIVETLTGSWNGFAFTPSSSGTQYYTNCFENSGAQIDTCSRLQLNSALPTSVSGSLMLMLSSGELPAPYLAGTIETSQYDGISSGATTKYTYSIGTVPVPAAAWLFGSGLIGLAGAARRKIK